MAEERKRRRPLSRSRKLGSRRRRGRRGADEDENDDEDEDSGGDDSDDSSSDSDSSDDDDSSSSDPPEQTVPVNKLPSPGGSGTPDLSSVPAAPPAEKWAKLRGSARRFGSEFSNYLVGLGQTAHQSGVDFNQKVVRPFSHALFEAAICVAFIFITGVFGVMFGSYLKTINAKGSQTVSFQNRTVRPGQQLEQGFFSTGFDTAKLHKRANRVLDEHLSALQDSKFVDAYALLSPAWKKQLSFNTFENGYSATKVIAYDIGKVETLDARRIRLRAELKVQEQGKERLYSAVYIAVLTPDGWRLDGGTFK